MKWKPGARHTQYQENNFRRASATFCIDGLDEPCRKCGKPSDAVVRRKPYCYPCGYEVYFGEQYVPPTGTEKRAMTIMCKATVALIEEGPYRDDGIIKHYSLNRLGELIEDISAREPWVS